MEELEIRYTEAKDEKYLHQWLADTDTLKSYPPSSEAEVNIFTSNWIGFARIKSSLTAMLNGEVCAIGTLFLMPYKKVSHQSILYMIVDPKYRNKGIGSDLLKNMLHLAKDYFKLEVVTVEVMDGSNLIKILDKYGFEKYGLQPDYINDNGKLADRILYQHFL